MSRLVIAGGTIVTMDAARRVVVGDVVVEDGRIVEIVQSHDASDASAQPHDAGAQRIDASGCIVLPGLVQAHTHLCQTLCRGAADDLPLLEWLRQRVWPYEAALDERAMRACARLAVAELLLGGTTAILDMGTVHETDALFDAVAATGLRATIGKAMMDVGDGVPARLREETRRSLDESDALARPLARRRRRAPALRLRAALRPVVHRGAPARGRHARAPRRAAAHARLGAAGGDRASCGASAAPTTSSTSSRSGWPVRAPRSPTASTPPTTSGVAWRPAARTWSHCPSSNLKLGSGIAPIPEMLAQGIHVALGADGAPCNNNLDGFVELRLAALLHKPRAGATAMPAATVLELATRGGAARARARGRDRLARAGQARRPDRRRAAHAARDARRSIRCRRWSTPRRAATCATWSSTAACSCATARSPSSPASTAREVVATAQAEATRVQARVRA